MSARAISSKRILDEKIESAYLNLYGYDPHVQLLFDSVTDSLAVSEEDSFTRMLQVTQTCVQALGKTAKPYVSAQLGNQLRAIIHRHREVFGDTTSRMVDMFRNEMLRLIGLLLRPTARS